MRCVIDPFMILPASLLLNKIEGESSNLDVLAPERGRSPFLMEHKHESENAGSTGRGPPCRSCAYIVRDNASTLHRDRKWRVIP